MLNPAPPSFAAVTPHERVRKLLLNHLQIIERAAQDQADEPLRQACADFSKAVAELPATAGLKTAR